MLVTQFHPQRYVYFGTRCCIYFNKHFFSVGEQTQAPKFYKYLADLSPKGQAALFQGFAFLPTAIAWLVGGTFGG